MHSVELNMNWEWPAGNPSSGPFPYRFAPSAPVSRRGDGYEMSSFTAAMTDCRPALASPNSICVLGSKYSSFSMPA